MSLINQGTESTSPVANAAAVAAPINNPRLTGESRKNFQHLLDSLVAHHRPQDYAERLLVDSIATVQWRQIQTVNALLTLLEPKDKTSNRLGSKSVQSLLRYQKSLNQQLSYTRRNLAIQQDLRKSFTRISNAPPQSCPLDVDITAFKNVKFPYGPSPANEHSTRTSKTAAGTAQAK